MWTIQILPGIVNFHIVVKTIFHMKKEIEEKTTTYTHCWLCRRRMPHWNSKLRRHRCCPVATALNKTRLQLRLQRRGHHCTLLSALYPCSHVQAMRSVHLLDGAVISKRLSPRRTICFTRAVHIHSRGPCAGSCCPGGSPTPWVSGPPHHSVPR